MLCDLLLQPSEYGSISDDFTQILQQPNRLINLLHFETFGINEDLLIVLSYER